MDNNKDREKIIITGNMVARFVCVLGLISVVYLTVLNVMKGNMSDLVYDLLLGFGCIMGIVLTRKKN